MLDRLKTWWDEVREGERSLWLYGLAAAGVLLIVFGGLWKPRPQPVAPSIPSSHQAESVVWDLSGELERILGRVEGAGRVQVMITYEQGPVSHYAQQGSVDETQFIERGPDGVIQERWELKERYDLVLRRDGQREEPIFLWEDGPVVRGVIVLAEGARDSRVKASLHQAVTTVLGIPSHKVSVIPHGGR